MRVPFPVPCIRIKLNIAALGLPVDHDRTTVEVRACTRIPLTEIGDAHCPAIGRGELIAKHPREPQTLQFHLRHRLSKTRQRLGHARKYGVAKTRVAISKRKRRHDVGAVTHQGGSDEKCHAFFAFIQPIFGE